MSETRFDALSPFKGIRRSIIYSFTILLAITLFIFYMISVRYTEKTVMNNSIHYKSKLVRQVNRDIDSYIYNMENISDLIVQGGDVQNYLFDDMSMVEKTEIYHHIMTQFLTVLKTRQDISNIAVVTSEGKYIINEGKDRLNGNIKLTDVEWYTQAINGHDSILTPSHVQYVIYNNYKWVVTLSKGIANPETGKNEGVFFIDLNYKVLKDLCDNNSMASSSYVFIIDDQGKIIYHPKQQLLYSGLAEEEIDQVLGSDTNHFITDEGEDSKLYTISVSEKTGWRVVGVTYLSELMKDKKETQKMYMILAFILLFVAVALSFFFAEVVAKPLRIKMIQLTSTLTKLLEQDNLSNGKRVLLEQEVEYARSYLMIQKMHYKERLDYEIDIDSDINKESVINLILQPIVENSIIHGFQSKDSKRMVKIVGYGQEDDIILKVIDNGIGMDEETLQNIFDISKVNEEDSGAGIHSVQTRIQLLYGKDYGLHIESTPEVGTTVTIKIPKDFSGGGT